MLELRPPCENCNVSLPPDSKEAMICTFECTFCKDCVELLSEVCPNCGGGFQPRPIRPALIFFNRETASGAAFATMKPNTDNRA